MAALIAASIRLMNPPPRDRPTTMWVRSALPRVVLGKRIGDVSSTPARHPTSTLGKAGSVAVWPGGDIDLVALGVGEGPPFGRVLVADHATTSGDRRRDARLGLVVRDIEIDV